jgi:hypothetical protein
VAFATLTAKPPLQQDTIPHAVICSLTLLKIGSVCPKHVELILEINKYCYFFILAGFAILQTLKCSATDICLLII